MTTASTTFTFPPFRLDLEEACLWRGTTRLAVPPKDFAVLHYLVSPTGQLVTHAELLQAVWPDTVVSAKGLKVFVRRLRQVLDDTAATPRFIETVARRGYRFLPTVTTAAVFRSQFQVPRGDASAQPRREESPAAARGTRNQQRATLLVGRDAELVQLHSLLEKAQTGTRQIVFVTGEPGIGKTTLVDAFLAGVSNWELGMSPLSSQSLDPKSQIPDPGAWVARGQCIEAYGQGEAYLPVLEALGRLARSEVGPTLKAVLAQYAPTWLLHLPAIVTAEEAPALQMRTLGVRQERMVRELAEALEVLTVTQPLILVFEDLHWADASTLTLLNALAHRHEPARLLILGTYRSSEATRVDSPMSRLVQDLAEHRLRQEVAVSLLNENALTAYLAARFPLSLLPTRLAQVLYQRTEGNPLFVVSILQDWLARSIITQSEGTWVFQGNIEALLHETPEEIRRVVINQGMRLQAETRRVLEAASVAGMEFSAAEVAAALETAVADVEEQCARLAAQQQFLRPAGISEWPDQTMAARYAFLHAVYQAVWHEQVIPAQLQAWHRRIGERKEIAYGKEAGEIAGELAMHFEQGRDYGKAVPYLQHAAGIALRRSANVEAIRHLTTGLDLLKTLPATQAQAQRELSLQLLLGVPLMATKGWAAPEMEHAYGRALELCHRSGETPQLFSALWGLWAYYAVRGELRRGAELSRRMLHSAQCSQDPALLLVAHRACGATDYFLGELPAARGHIEEGLRLYDCQLHAELAFVYGEDLGVACLFFAAAILWALGYPDQAWQKSQAALGLAQELAHAHTLAEALFFAGRFHQLRREAAVTQELAERGVALSAEQGLRYWLALNMNLRGWALAVQGQLREGIQQMEDGLAAARATGLGLALDLPLAMLAEAYAENGRIAEGLAVLSEALAHVDTTGGRWGEAELHRLKGALILRLSEQSPEARMKNAESCFHKALEIARHQQGKSWELRAATSLARLWLQQGKRTEACTLLSEIYSWFTEGFDTKDLQEAKVLLEELH